MALTKGAKKGLIILIVGSLFITGMVYGYKHGAFDAVFKHSQVVGKVDLPNPPTTSTGQKVALLPLPSDNVTSKNFTTSGTMEVMKWNAQAAMLYANGGPITTKGSIMEMNGVKLTINNIDDQSVSMKNMIAFAAAYKKDPNATGTNFYVIMGDAGPETFGPLNYALKKEGLGEAEAVGPIGTSKGEDGLWADSSWKKHPENAKGSVIAAVLRDGDWDVAVKWAGDNDIPVNGDPTTHDPNAINFVNASDYIDAGKKYISGATVDLYPIGEDGKPGKDKVTYKVVGFASWTPVDVTVAKSKGGVAKIASTKDYNTQMYATIIGLKKWDEDHKEYIINLLKSCYQGADQINSSETALDKAGVISAAVYKAESGPYWVKYDKGVTEFDVKNNPVELGGSSQMNLADALVGYGLTENSTNIYAAVYNTFKSIDLKYYPEVFKDGGIPDVDKIQNLEYLTTLKQETEAAGSKATISTDAATAAKNDYNKGDIHDAVSKKSVHIEFSLGSAELTAEGKAQVKALVQSALVAGGLRVQVEGYTDNTGNPASNQTLSEERAASVVQEFKTEAPGVFVGDRAIIAKGYGGSKQIYNNSQDNTPAGRAANRRVVIILGN